MRREDPRRSGQLNGIGVALARLREKAGLSQEDLAGKRGITGSSISRLEAPTANPEATSIGAYLDVVGCTLHDLAGALDEVNGRTPPAGARLLTSLPRPVGPPVRHVAAPSR